MLVLGLNLFHPDASAAVIQDGKILFAVAEERLNRKKHFAGFPLEAIRMCLKAAGVKMSDIEHVAIGRDPKANRAQKVKYALAHLSDAKNLVSLARRTSRFGDLRTLMAEGLGEDPARMKFVEHNVEHHLAHMAASFYPSGWDTAAGFTYDGSGDFVSAMMARGEGLDIHVHKRVFVPDSLGAVYSMVCEFIGFPKYGDEGKVMGLAPYGTDAAYEKLKACVHETPEGYKLNRDFFVPFASQVNVDDAEVTRRRRFGDAMLQRFGEPRTREQPLEQRHKDLAWAVQRRFEEVFFHTLRKLHAAVPNERLVLSGGCALNSVANGKVFDETPFRETEIHPAAGDEGLAIGAALYVTHAVLRRPRTERLQTAALGPEYSEVEVKQALDAAGLQYTRLDGQPYLDAVASHIAAGDIVGWFQGRMEWGPRALGNRSILAHPGRTDMKEILNSRIKNREAFRPFAPAILAERQTEYFEHAHPSPFMLHVYKIKPEKRAELCAVNHVDNTGRMQSVTREQNAAYYDVIKAFDKKTGIPVVINTSFNENEPIVCTPAEAVDCYARTKMDVIAIGPFIASKKPA
jgi:carbamoyltransferase